MVQSITGIPYYYRQFGYEMAMSLGGGRLCYKSAIPALKEGQAEPFVLRQVTEADLPFVMAIDAHVASRSLVNLVRDERLWRFELFGRFPGNVNALEWRILQTPAGERVGVIGFHAIPWNNNRIVTPWVELAPGWSYVEACREHPARAEG